MTNAPLFDPFSFVSRHIGTGADAQNTMLDAVGYSTTEQLVEAAVPSSIRAQELASSSLPPAATEREALAELRAYARKNTVNRSLIGLGYYDTITPAVIKRNVLENPSWYTAYTPYQPEISQGRLEALINFQTMVADLTGLTTANSSMLDEGTAVVEGMLLARRASKSTSNVFIVDADSLPQTKALLQNRADAVGIDLVELPLASLPELAEGSASTGSASAIPDAFGVFVQYPGASGCIWNPSEVIAKVKDAGGITVVAADLLAMTMIKSPGDLGADVAVGTTQRFGVPMAFGGPHAGYLAVREGLERQLPGRLVGVSKDADGHPAYRLTLQAREQHIRREKATSNICTAQVLLAVMASMYAVYHGPQGLRAIAERVTLATRYLADAATDGGHTVVNGNYFDTLLLETDRSADELIRDAYKAGYLLNKVDENRVSLSVDETTSVDDVIAIAHVLGAESEYSVRDDIGGWLPEQLARTSDYLTHPVFNTHRSETSMMRHLKHHADK